jgi:hypothetical protein
MGGKTCQPCALWALTVLRWTGLVRCGLPSLYCMACIACFSELLHSTVSAPVLFPPVMQVLWFEGEGSPSRVGHPTASTNRRTVAPYYMSAGNGSTAVAMNCSAFR